MREVGSCHICGRPATQSCMMCGSLTCDKHLKNGICLECRKGKNFEGGGDRDISPDDVYS